MTGEQSEQPDEDGASGGTSMTNYSLRRGEPVDVTEATGTEGRARWATAMIQREPDGADGEWAVNGELRL